MNKKKEIARIITVIIFLMIFSSSNSYSDSYFLALKEGIIYSDKDLSSLVIGTYKRGDFFGYALEEGEWFGLWDINNHKVGYTFSPDWTIFYAQSGWAIEAAKMKLAEIEEYENNQAKLKKEIQEKEQQRKKEEEILKRKVKTFPKEIQELINNKRIRLGLTTEQVTLSWGKPEKINETVGSWGKHEQWIYGSTSLYFENGILTSYQTSR